MTLDVSFTCSTDTPPLLGMSSVNDPRTEPCFELGITEDALNGTTVCSGHLDRDNLIRNAMLFACTLHLLYGRL